MNLFNEYGSKLSRGEGYKKIETKKEDNKCQKGGWQVVHVSDMNDLSLCSMINYSGPAPFINEGSRARASC